MTIRSDILEIIKKNCERITGYKQMQKPFDDAVDELEGLYLSKLQAEKKAWKHIDKIYDRLTALQAEHERIWGATGLLEGNRRTWAQEIYSLRGDK